MGVLNAEMKSADAIGIYWKCCLDMSEQHRADGISRSDFSVFSAESTRYGCTELRMWDMEVFWINWSTIY